MSSGTRCLLIMYALSRTARSWLAWASQALPQWHDSNILDWLLKDKSAMLSDVIGRSVEVVAVLGQSCTAVCMPILLSALKADLDIVCKASVSH